MTRYKYISLFSFIFLFVLLVSCNDNSPLPFLGQSKIVEGKTVYHTIPNWKMVNQDSLYVSNQDLRPFIYVSDFFFTSCPSICPRVTKEMLKIYEEFKSEPRVKLVSFTIDPKRDTPSKLKLYGDNLAIDHEKWWFLSGDKAATFELANAYFVVAFEDASVPGGFDHSGKIILTDQDGHIRSFSEGTDPESTPKLIGDIKKLLKESK
jgi:protein SCO1